MSTTFIKLSLLFQYLRVFEGRRTRATCIVLIVLVSLWGLSYSIIAWVPCNPVHAFWDFTVDAVCWGYDSPDPVVFAATYNSHTALNMAFDIAVFLTPVPLYFKKNTPVNTRMALMALLVMGAM